MSLLPRIPLRKLFIDSRYALPGSTATDFEIEVPQGGLDLLDNTIAMIPEISVPTFFRDSTLAAAWATTTSVPSSAVNR